MLKVGLTGGIASGKSTVAKWFQERGIRVFDADLFVHKQYHNPDVLSEIEQALGSKYFDDKGVINRTLLAKDVFANIVLRKKLEGIIHPLVLAEISNQCREAKEKKEKIIILDVPLLFEVGWDKFVDQVWVVYVTPEVQLKRLMLRNGLSEEQAKLRISSQIPIEEKIRRADVVINNSGTWSDTEKQLVRIAKELGLQVDY